MTFVTHRLMAALALLGRYGTQGFALSIFLGVALPQFAAAARPFLAISIFVFVTITFARLEPAAMRAMLRRPARLVLASLWLALAPAAALAAALAAIGRDAVEPGLVLGVALLGASPPIMSAPAVAMLLGLKPDLVMAAVLATTSAAPLVSPYLADAIAGSVVPLDVPVLVTRLVLLIGGAILGAGALRILLGAEQIRARKAQFDGLGVLMYFLFAVAAMDGVLAAALADPGRVARYLAIAFAISVSGFAAAQLLLRPLAPADRFALGYGTGQRNMGLLVAALGAATPDSTFLFFALAQFPIYLMPQILKPLARRFGAPADGSAPARPAPP